MGVKPLRFVLLLALFFCNAVYAEIHPVDVSAESIALGASARVIKDQDKALSAAQLLDQPERYPGFQGEAINSFSFTDAAYWFVVPLNNPSTASLTRLLTVEPAWLDGIHITLAAADGSLLEFHGGDYYPFSQRSIMHRKFNASLKLPPGQSQLLVRVQTRDPLVVNMQLWERSAFYRADSHETAYLGLVYGVLGAMLLYNLVLFVAVRESVYAAYVGYVLIFMLWHATSNGLLYQWLWPTSPQWANWAQSVFIYLTVMAGLYFAINFLQLRQRMPRIYRWARGLLLTFFISSIVTALLGGYQLHVISAILWIIPYTPAVIIFGLLSLRAGNRAARFFLPATAAGFLGSGITALAVSGIIPFSFYTYRAVDFGMLIDAVLLSIALADRLKLARNETEQARTALFDAVQEHAQELETTVDQRTQELREANATKDKFFTIIAHDLRGPLGSLAMFYNDIVKSAEDFTDEILTLTRDTTNNTSNLLEQLLTWARSQRGEIDYKPQAFDLSLLTPEIEQLFSSQASAKQIQLDVDIDGPCWVYADKAMVHTILRNLTSNALKYTAAGGAINAEITCDSDLYKFSITDSGIGIDKAVQQSLFRLDEKPQSLPGTNNETGTGLGLILCSEFVQRNSGNIGVTSEKGKGATFWFTLPRASTQDIHQPDTVHELQRALTILVADDQQISRETTAQLLQAMQHSVYVAQGGAEAVQLAAEQHFDLILMDIEMPVVNGVEATRLIRTNNSEQTILAFSSYFSTEIKQLAKGDIFDGDLEKPLSRETLGAELHRLFTPITD